MAEGQSSLQEADIHQLKRILIFLQGVFSDALRDSSYVTSVIQLMFLMLIPKN